MSSKRFPFKQVIVIGGTGQTGHRALELLLEKSDVKIVATSREVKAGLPNGPLASCVVTDAQAWAGRVEWAALDLEAKAPVLKNQLTEMAQKLSPETSTALIFTAAYTNVEGCESEPERCRSVNETNTQAVLYWARTKFGAKLAFFSTDYVFDGADGPYIETAPRKATSRYGQSKATVEEWLERNAADALIVRTTGVYDYLPGSKNFLMQMIELWGQGKTTRIPSDQYSNPVWAHELAKATIELLERGASGIFHVAGGSYLARTEFAREIARVFDLNAALVNEVRTEELGQKAKRPLRGGLKCEKVKAELGWAPASAAEVLKQLRRNKI